MRVGTPGLNDISREGNFTWEDRGERNFTARANNQPNKTACTHLVWHVLIRINSCTVTPYCNRERYNYEWNDVKRSECHQYTCKKGTINIRAIYTRENKTRLK